MSGTIHAFENIRIYIEYSHCQFRVDGLYASLWYLKNFRFFLTSCLFTEREPLTKLISVPPSSLGGVSPRLWRSGGMRIGSRQLIWPLEDIDRRHRTYAYIPGYRRRQPCFPRVEGPLYHPVASARIFLSLLLPSIGPL